MKKLLEAVLFAMLGTLMFVSRIALALLPNIHIVAVLIAVLSVVYRWKALIPLYLYVALEGLFSGWAPWWIPYLYVWTVQWGLVMLVPKRLWDRLSPLGLKLLCGCACALFGFAYGTLYAPGQALMYGYSLQQTLAWIVAGLPFDAIHGISNLCMGWILSYPLIKVLKTTPKYLRN